MKKLKYVFLTSAALVTAFAVAGCGDKGGGTPAADFSFYLSFESGRTDKIFTDSDEILLVNEQNPGSGSYNYTFSLLGGAENYITVTKNTDGKSFTVHPTGETTTEQKIGINVKEEGSNKKKTQWFYVDKRNDPANTGYNFSGDTEKKEEVLGKLEEYAMKNFLTGIPIYENAGYIRKASRVHYGTDNYIANYGFGLLREGYLDYDDPVQPLVPAKYRRYFQTAMSTDPGNIAGWNATGSVVGDLYGYITSSFWGLKLNAARTNYEWYPILASDDCPDPIPLDGEGLSIHKKYRVYVKTGNDIRYRQVNGGDYDIDHTKFNNRPVSIDDYIFTYKLLLTQKAQLTRGAEFATNQSTGFKGAYSYFRKTEKATDEQADIFWNDMTDSGELGIVAGHDGNGDYIDFEFLNPIDVFTAKSNLSSSLTSPIPEDFLKSLGNGSWIAGGEVFGTGSKSDSSGEILKNVLCLGPWYLEDWVSNQEIVFKRDDNWFEYTESYGTDHPVYRIDGVHLLIVDTQTDDASIYYQYNAGVLDQTSIPVSKMNERVGTDLPTKGDTTFKLNVNACTQERWDELFWSNKYPDVYKPTSRYLVKPWMSNYNFLNGLFWSINRSEFAADRGYVPSYNYFADAYMSDPVGGVSYNSTTAHSKAEDGFDPQLRTSNYGYNEAKATGYFKAAINELASSGAITLGTPSNKAKVTIDIQWQADTNKITLGEDIERYFKTAFNKADDRVELIVNHNADPLWEQTYSEHLQVGRFDLGLGSIGGDVFSPLWFMSVLRSDNQTGYTLNWGKDTALVDPDDPITFTVMEDGHEVLKEWSYDAAWEAADHGSVVKNGEAVDSVEVGYTKSPTKLDGTTPVNRLSVEGGILECAFEFVNVDEGVEFEIDRVQITLVGYGSITIDESNIEKIYEASTGRLKGFKIIFGNEIYKDGLTIYEYINKCLFDGLKLQTQINNLNPSDPLYEEKKADLENPFAYDYYYPSVNSYWWIDVYYNIIIAGSVPAENYYQVKKINDGQSSSGLATVRM